MGHAVRRDASLSGPKRCADRSDISASNAGASSPRRCATSGPRSIQTMAEAGRDVPSGCGLSGRGTRVKGPPDRWISVETLPCGIGCVTAKAMAFWPYRKVRAPMPTASRTLLSRPSAPITSRARSRVPSVRVTRASVSRVSTSRTPVPIRRSTCGRSSSRARISRRSSQLGRFQPNGASEMSEASKSWVERGSALSPPASTMRMTCRSVACGASRSQIPAAASVARPGCKIAVVRRSASRSASAVTGGRGSRRVTENPAVPRPAAAASPAGPAPAITISVSNVLIGWVDRPTMERRNASVSPT